MKATTLLRWGAPAVFALLAIHRLRWLLEMTAGVIGWDARVYFRAARTAFTGGNPYAGGEIGVRFLNHPALLLIVRPFAGLEDIGTWVWIALLAAAWIGTLRIIEGSFGGRSTGSISSMNTGSIGDRRSGRVGGWSSVILLALLTPAVEGVFMGQASIAAGLCLAAAYVLDRREESFAAGILLGLAVIFKFSLAIFLLYFLLLRRWRAILAAGLLLAAASAAAEWLVLPGVHRMYLGAVLEILSGIHPGPTNASLVTAPWLRFLGAATLAGVVLAALRGMRPSALFGDPAASQGMRESAHLGDQAVRPGKREPAHLQDQAVRPGKREPADLQDQAVRPGKREPADLQDQAVRPGKREPAHLQDQAVRPGMRRAAQRADPTAGRGLGEPAVFGALAAWSLLFSPLTWHHHGVFLAVPIAAQLSRRPWLGLTLAALIQTDLLGRLAGFPIHTLTIAAGFVLLLAFLPQDTSETAPHSD